MAQMASTWGEDDNNEADCFELFDGDGSGTMSYEEFETNLIELFDSLNYNTLASEEEKQLAKNNIGRLQKHFDQNLDGHIHSVEFRAALQSKLVPPTTTITTVDEDNNVVEQEVNTADMDAVQSNAEVIRQQRVLVGVDMTLKTGTLHVRVKRGDLMHDTSGFGDKKMDPYVCGCGLVVGCGCWLVVGWLWSGCWLDRPRAGTGVKCTHGNNPHLCFLLFSIVVPSLCSFSPLSLPSLSLWPLFFSIFSGASAVQTCEKLGVHEIRQRPTQIPGVDRERQQHVHLGL